MDVKTCITSCYSLKKCYIYFLRPLFDIFSRIPSTKTIKSSGLIINFNELALKYWNINVKAAESREGLWMVGVEKCSLLSLKMHQFKKKKRENLNLNKNYDFQSWQMKLWKENLVLYTCYWSGWWWGWRLERTATTR